MDDFVQWTAGNEGYLASALAWLRLRLTRQAAQTEEPAPRSAPVDEAELAEAERTMAAAEALEPPPPLIVLSRRLGLSRFEREVLLLCAAMELDTRIAALCARAQGDPNRPYPTFALALSVFDEPAWDVLSPDRPLRYWRLVEVNQVGPQPLTSSPLCADERITNFVKGLNYIDARLRPLLTPVTVTSADVGVPPSQQAVVDAIVGHLREAGRTRQVPVIQLLGPHQTSKRLVAWHASRELGLYLYHVPVELLLSSATDQETVARLWQRESILLPLALYLDAQEAAEVTPIDGPAGPLSRFLARTEGVFFLDTRDVRPDLGRDTVDLDVTKPTRAEQQAAWTAALGSISPEVPALLAGQFNLNRGTIQEVVQSVSAGPPSEAQDVGQQLWDACLVRARPRLDTLAQRLNPRARWEDIVLPDNSLNLLREIANQVRQRGKVYEDWGFRQRMNRGFGITVLFAGESGTGKTMAAEILATDLRLNLYRIDLSAVVSKYIGETEKNLRRLFDAAEDGGAILFFDEADALFGKRSQVRDSHDRYANIEVNYLLQRMEAYQGVAILATNMKGSLDDAFTRRIRFMVNFRLPEPEERKLIWQKVFPAQTPVDGLDYDRLSRYNLTGGGIFNSGLNAAFLAAQAGTAVTMPTVLKAIRTEFLKSDRLIDESEFVWGGRRPDEGKAA